MAEFHAPTDALNAVPSPPSPSGYSSNAIHLLRTVQQINLSLSQMADHKASILMGATFLVFTIAVGQAANGTMPAALGVLALFAFLSAMCAVWAVLPSVGRPVSGRLDDRTANKLFFGTFTGLDEDEWIASVLADLRSDEAMFRAILHDVYQNGQVLQRKKYKFLAYAYQNFMIGLCLTAITFVVEYGVKLA
ncbi:MAG: Pycsar system effector family protein [Erythrobacter sp.]